MTTPNSRSADVAKRVIQAMKDELCPTCGSKDKHPHKETIRTTLTTYEVDATCNSCGDAMQLTISVIVADA